MNELQTAEQSDITEIETPQTAVQLRAQVNLIQEVMKSVMKKDTHYGVIPGCKEPSLYKPGAEKIMATFRLSADPKVEDLSDDDNVRYRVKISLVSPSGWVAGYGIGECSSGEEKYKWRKTAHDNEFNATPEDRRRLKYYKNGGHAKQIRIEPADVANTVLKMAKKRALVDAVLTTTSASDIFTQDIEDIPEELRQDASAVVEPVATVSDDQYLIITSMLDENDLDQKAFLDWVETRTTMRDIKSLPASAFSTVVAALKKKIADKQASNKDE